MNINHFMSVIDYLSSKTLLYFVCAKIAAGAQWSDTADACMWMSHFGLCMYTHIYILNMNDQP